MRARYMILTYPEIFVLKVSSRCQTSDDALYYKSIKWEQGIANMERRLKSVAQFLKKIWKFTFIDCCARSCLGLRSVKHISVPTVTVVQN